jgi:hypothetical protein
LSFRPGKTGLFAFGLIFARSLREQTPTQAMLEAAKL